MTILKHTFDEASHIYAVEGRTVLSTSDAIYLNGLSDYSQVPSANLAHAAWRGKQFHLAIRYFEEDGEAPDVPEEVEPYFRGYLKFRTEYEFEPIGPMEKEIVYEHEGTGQAIGCTIDLRGLVRGVPFILDAKSSAKQYGQAKKQKLLAWRMQTQSYIEASRLDPDFMTLEGTGINKSYRGIIHCNKEGGFEFHDFSKFEDSRNWNAAVRMAVLKLENGYKLDERRNGNG